MNDLSIHLFKPPIFHYFQGFARYSTDSKWHVPHFEKMLYDQGQLVTAYCDAFLVSNNVFYADVVRGILNYVERDLSDEVRLKLI